MKQLEEKPAARGPHALIEEIKILVLGGANDPDVKPLRPLFDELARHGMRGDPQVLIKQIQEAEAGRHSARQIEKAEAGRKKWPERMAAARTSGNKQSAKNKTKK